MAETKAVDPWSAPKSEWVTVEVPREDIFGNPHPPIHLNHRPFRPGKHHVPPQVGEEIVDRVRLKLNRDRQLMNARPNATVVANYSNAGGIEWDPNSQG